MPLRWRGHKALGFSVGPGSYSLSSYARARVELAGNAEAESVAPPSPRGETPSFAEAVYTRGRAGGWSRRGVSAGSSVLYHATSRAKSQG